MSKWVKRMVILGTGIAVLTGAFLISVNLGATAPVQGKILASPLNPGPVLHYQGRLLDPTTGNPKPDGFYEVNFRIYNVASGGTPLWSETKDVDVENGVFSTLLGDTTILDTAIFNGQDLWLGVKVGTDAEATPRQRITFVGYSIRAEDADTVDGQHASAFAGASHLHSGGEIDGGTVLESFIDPALTRDGEVMEIVLAGDGAGSALDADTVDGQHASAFAASSHTHDTRYYTEGESDSRFVNATGDTMSGALAVPKITYTTPRTHYFVVGGEGFVPGSDVPYFNTYGVGGAYINTSTGGHALVAPVHLPQGAVVTSFKVFFNDTSSSDMSVRLQRLNLNGGLYTTLAQVSSSGTSGYYSLTDSTISVATVDNTASSYHVYAFSSAWSSSLKIMGALVEYTIGEAP